MMSQEGTQADASTGGDQEQVVDYKAQFEAAQRELEEARAEAAKNRALKQKIAQERDELKKATKSTGEEDYKTLWEQERQQAQKLVERQKNSDVQVALTQQLGKIGVRADAMDAAIQLVDKGIIEWDAETGVARTSVEAAAQVLKGKFKFLFEKPVTAQDGKSVVDGTSSERTLKRAEFDRLDAVAKATKMKEGYKLID